MKSKNILIFTDIGDDIDDSLALTYLLTKTQQNICGIITRWPQEEKMSYLKELLGILDKNDAWPLISWSNSADDTINKNVMIDVWDSLPSSYEILSLWPMTDIATLLNHTNRLPEKIYSQWTVLPNGKPSGSSYNYRLDINAAFESLHIWVPHTRVDKNISYQYPISKNKFNEYSKHNAAWKYLYEQAITRHTKFKKLNRKKFNQIYTNNDTLSYPYDLLTAISLHEDISPWRVNALHIPQDILSVLY